MNVPAIATPFQAGFRDVVSGEERVLVDTYMHYDVELNPVRHQAFLHVQASSSCVIDTRWEPEEHPCVYQTVTFKEPRPYLFFVPTLLCCLLPERWLVRYRTKQTPSEEWRTQEVERSLSDVARPEPRMVQRFDAAAMTRAYMEPGTVAAVRVGQEEPIRHTATCSLSHKEATDCPDAPRAAEALLSMALFSAVVHALLEEGEEHVDTTEDVSVWCRAPTPWEALLLWTGIRKKARNDVLIVTRRKKTVHTHTRRTSVLRALSREPRRPTEVFFVRCGTYEYFDEDEALAAADAAWDTPYLVPLVLPGD